MKLAPFPWFGGKSRAAPLVWSALGKVKNYVEPFAGSLASLLARPWEGERLVETINDKDAMLCNFWRAVAAEPETVAGWADWPVNETDLTARHVALVERIPAVTARLEAEADWHDAQLAGWWVWGCNAWLGSGWCSGTGPWIRDGDRLVKRTPGRGVNRQLPHLGDPGRGVNRQLPHLGTPGQGVNRQLPHLGTPGRGVAEWFTWLAERLRWVRVCCGDWRRVVQPSVLRCGDPCGVLLDPPYEQGTAGLYSAEVEGIATEAAEWAFANGDNPSLRIVLCGHVGQHEVPPGWEVEIWERSGGYEADGRKAEEFKECLWLSPHCHHSIAGPLFA